MNIEEINILLNYDKLIQLRDIIVIKKLFVCKRHRNIDMMVELEV